MQETREPFLKRRDKSREYSRPIYKMSVQHAVAFANVNIWYTRNIQEPRHRYSNESNIYWVYMPVNPRLLRACCLDETLLPIGSVCTNVRLHSTC